ncbi:MAG: hypothetical protein ABR541_04350, partial [Candidatus Dormibacteria bacterium]
MSPGRRPAASPWPLRLLLAALLAAPLAAGVVPLARVAAASPGPAVHSTTLTYCTPQRQPLQLDLSTPRGWQRRRSPVVVFVHGGSWAYGSRRSGDLLEVLRPALLERGFAFAAVDYRLAGTA